MKYIDYRYIRSFDFQCHHLGFFFNLLRFRITQSLFNKGSISLYLKTVNDLRKPKKQ